MALIRQIAHTLPLLWVSSIKFEKQDILCTHLSYFSNYLKNWFSFLTYLCLSLPLFHSLSHSLLKTWIKWRKIWNNLFWKWFQNENQIIFSISFTEIDFSVNNLTRNFSIYPNWKYCEQWWVRKLIRLFFLFDK